VAVIRYIAFISEKPEELAKFYNRFLGTRELGRSPEEIWEVDLNKWERVA
jgi:hypothetical protein